MCIFVESQKNQTDPNNHPVKRTVQLFSRASKLHVQITKTELDARGRDGSGFGKLSGSKLPLSDSFMISSCELRFLVMNILDLFFK